MALSSISIQATVTTEGEKFMASQGITGKAYVIEKFVVGKGGHDSSDPDQTLSPDKDVLYLPQETFGPKLLNRPNPIETGVMIEDTCARYTGMLDYYEANGPISSIGLIARVTYSPIPADPEVGRTFLFAYGNRPLISKVDADQLIVNITLKA